MEIDADTGHTEDEEFAPFEPAEVRRAILDFPKYSAPGPSGLRHSHLQEALTCGAAGLEEQFLDTITLFCNLAASGRLPRDFSQMLSAARLLPFAKKTGGVRPIAVGETL